MTEQLTEHERYGGVVVPIRPGLDPEAVPPDPRVRVLRNVRERARVPLRRLARVRPTRHQVHAVARHAGFGVLGLVRFGGVYWRWVTAAEYATDPKAGPELVERVRHRRRRTSYVLVPLASAGLLAGWLWWWPLPVLLSAAGLVTASAVEQAVRRGPVGQEQGHTPLGHHPGGKAVRRTVANAGLGKFDDLRVIGPVVRDEAAWTAVVELPPGTPAVKAMRRRVELAAAAGVDVAQLAIDPVPGHAGRITLWVADDDPLAGDAITSPLAGRTAVFDAWREKIPVGVDVRGRPIAFRLPERSLLTGGEPGAGKSVASNNLLCALALDPHVRLWPVDGKGGSDLLDYEPIAERFVGEPDVAAVLGLLTDLRDEMADRYRKLKAVGHRKVTGEIADELGIRLLVLHIDELQAFTCDDEHGKRVVRLLWDLVSRGRAAGIVVSGATQRPAADVVPTRLRDILSIRWALRCTTPQASDTILGQGWASRGFNAASIDPTQRGAGYLLAEGSLPAPMRTYYLGDDDVTALTRRAHRLREAAGTLPLSDARPPYGC
ncbi:FtsK/SpoIIIE domain-containing protein [Planomonospora algeriensis]